MSETPRHDRQDQQDYEQHLIGLLDRAHNALEQLRDRIDYADLAAARADQAIGELSRALADRNALEE